MDLIVIGCRFSQTGQTTTGTSSTGTGFFGNDRKRLPAADEVEVEVVMGCSFSCPVLRL
jgi:hypothetical protein